MGSLGAWNRRALLLACAVVALGVARADERWLPDRAAVATAEPDGPPVTFVEARENIKDLSMIEPAWVALRTLPARYAPRHPCATRLDQVVGRVALVHIYVGEPVVPSRLCAPEDAPGLAYRIRQGARAVTVEARPAGGLRLERAVVVDVWPADAAQADAPLVRGAVVLEVEHPGLLRGGDPVVTLEVEAPDAVRLAAVEGAVRLQAAAGDQPR